MMDKLQREDAQKLELQQLFLFYLESYLIQRNSSATYSMLSPSITGFGTGIDEKAMEPGSLLPFFERDFTEAPNPISYTLNKSFITLLDDVNAVVLAELDLQTMIQDHEVSFPGLRLTIVFHKTDKSWLVEHMHISCPSSLHQEKESYPIKEIQDRAKVLDKLVNERTRELEIARKELEKLAETDRLTGLYNRMKLDQMLMYEIQRADRYQSIFSVILFDLDNFKTINDTFGHQTGDHVLIELAGILRQRVRKTDLPGRWGGDEFLIILPETKSEDAASLAEIIRTTLVSYPFQFPLPVTSSFGITQWKPLDTYHTFIDRADKNLYQAKHNGKNQIVV